METTNTAIGQINLLPFQIGASSLNGMRTGEGNGFPCGPFTAILEKIMQASGYHGGQSRMDGQPSVTFNDLPLSHIEAALLNGAQLQRGLDAEKNRIIAILQQIQQSEGGQSAREQFIEQLFNALGMISGEKVNGESIEESRNFPQPADQIDDPQGTSIEQAILASLARLMQSQSTTINKEKETGSAEENIVPDDRAEQDGSVEATAEEIAALLTLLYGSVGRQDMPVLEPAKAGASTDSEPENMSIAQNHNRVSEPAECLSVPQRTEGVAGLDGEEASQPADNGESSKASTEKLASEVQGTLLASSLESGNQAANGAKRSEEAKDSGRKGVIEPETRQGSATEANTATGKQEPKRNGHTAGTEKVDTYGDIQRAASETNEEPLDRTSNGAATGQNTPSTIHREANGVEQHARVIYSRFHTDKLENHQATPNAEQAVSPDPQGLLTKAADKTESLFNKIDPDVARVDRFSESRSFARGEGDSDSHQLGHGLGSQGIMETVSAEKPEASSFGNIVADRIARTIEHIAQTNRADLTLRLKIDGSESVFLEMKERAGTITIGIQCQDKALVKALENQKEMMVRNLETKNLNTSISITSVGEDEPDGQRQWRRERQEQRRDNWNGRPRNSRSYFETLI